MARQPAPAAFTTQRGDTAGAPPGLGTYFLFPARGPHNAVPVITAGPALSEDAAGAPHAPRTRRLPDQARFTARQAEQAIKAPVTHRDNRKIPERKISALFVLHASG